MSKRVKLALLYWGAFWIMATAYQYVAKYGLLYWVLKILGIFAFAEAIKVTFFYKKYYEKEEQTE